jgi:UDP-N-acetylmuramoyl-tripeptide--D-alanyl-D-alanine ligase
MRELGPETAAAHADVATLAKELGVHELITVDSPEYGAGRPVADVAAATALLRAELAPGDVVLVKASRAAGLDRIAADLLGGHA